MIEDQKMKTVFNFRNTCFYCFSATDYPLLSDFLYGYLIFQTKDGLDFYYVELIENQTFDFINCFLKDNSKKFINKIDPQKVLALVADKPQGKEYALEYPICPNCKRKQNHFNDNNKTTERKIEFASWKIFESLTDESKAETIQDLIKYNQKSLR